MAFVGVKYLAGNLCQTVLTHDAIDEDEYQVEKDDESKSSQEDNTIHGVDLHSGLFQPGPKRYRLHIFIKASEFLLDFLI